jgi:two-component system, cell cycle response regulator DivK
MSSTPERIRRRVLVVEDNPLSVKLFSDLLDVRGCEVFQAGTAREAVKLAHDHLPDLILLDMRLPDGSGLDVAGRLKQDDQTKSIPIIVLTASSLGRDQADARGAGCDAFLVKPIAVQEFLRTIDEFLSRVSGRTVRADEKPAR